MPALLKPDKATEKKPYIYNLRSLFKTVGFPFHLADGLIGTIGTVMGA